MIKCTCCAKQIVSYKVEPNDKYCTNGPCISMGTLGWSCYCCSQDLDQNGLFPEEEGYESIRKQY